MPKIRCLGGSHPSYPSHCRSTASTQDLYPRSLGILGFSGCVRGFSMPKTMPKNKGTSTHKCAFCYFSYSGLARFTKA